MTAAEFHLDLLADRHWNADDDELEATTTEDDDYDNALDLL